MPRSFKLEVVMTVAQDTLLCHVRDYIEVQCNRSSVSKTEGRLMEYKPWWSAVEAGDYSGESPDMPGTAPKTMSTPWAKIRWKAYYKKRAQIKRWSKKMEERFEICPKEEKVMEKTKVYILDLRSMDGDREIKIVDKEVCVRLVRLLNLNKRRRIFYENANSIHIPHLYYHWS